LKNIIYTQQVGQISMGIIKTIKITKRNW
jgi:hypothetical protein